jgi:FtsZ-interacting cell division protein YlmF
VRKLLQLFGFYGDEYEDDESEYSDYEEEPQPRGVKKNNPGKKEDPRARPVVPKLIFFKGVPSEEIKLRLRDVLLEGTMVLLDLQGLDAERIEEGRSFLHFMGGVAFAHKGLMERIGPSLFVITPHEGMLQWWPGEE